MAYKSVLPLVQSHVLCDHDNTDIKAGMEQVSMNLEDALTRPREPDVGEIEYQIMSDHVHAAEMLLENFPNAKEMKRTFKRHILDVICTKAISLRHRGTEYGRCS